MPQKWWLPVSGLPDDVRSEHLHAAVTRWLDLSDAEHNAPKPYSISPPTMNHHRRGIYVGTLTGHIADRLTTAIKLDPSIRLGTRIGRAGQPREVTSRGWETLADPARPANRWQVDLLTPTTFRRGSVSSPLPDPRSILLGLADRWKQWSGGIPCPGDLPDTGYTEVRVTDLELRSVAFEWESGPGRGRRHKTYVVSGSVGWLRLHCARPELAMRADALLGLAEFAGIGGYTGRGLGVCRVTRSAGD